MKKLIGIIALMVIGETVASQNLILNPSFEEVTEITTRWSGTYADFDKRMKYWDSPNQGSPDILFVKALNKMHPKRPKVDLSNHLPRTGKFMVGIKTYGCNNTPHCKEYVQIKLEEPLQSGKQYYFEYWVNPIAPSVKVNSFGLALSMEGIKELMNLGLLDHYPVSMNEEIIDGGLNEWQRIASTFEADSNYEYIIIGNFSPDKSIEFKTETDGIEYGYYLLDDVLLRPLHQEKAKAPKLKTNEVIVLNNILFEFDKAVLQEISKPQLNELVEYLDLHQNYEIEIMGHTDSKGSKEHNLELSKNRANAIQQYLTSKGINDLRIHPTGLGSSYPIVANDSEENRKINRRVEIKIIEK